MAGLLSTLHTANSGMNSTQKGIQTVSHNISNINTPGYSRQRVELETNRPMYMPSINNSISKGQLGTGVNVENVTRARNTFYDFQFRSQSHVYGSISAKFDYYNSIEMVIKEPSEHGISANLNKFFQGFEELSKDVNSTSSKNLIVENANNLSSLISDSYEKLEAMKNDLDSNIDTEITQINEMLDRLETLEKDIKVVGATGSSPNDLLDERDRILDDLSFKLDIQNKDVQELLKDGKLEKGELDTAIKDGVSVSGSLSGYYEMNDKITSYTDSIKDISDSLVKEVNNALGEEFFIAGDPTKGEKLISVNEEFKNDPTKLEMTQEKAKEIFDIRNKKVDINGKELSLNEHYNAFAERIGIDSQKVINDEEQQREMVLSIDKSRMSVSGVSLDEEMINLIQLQHTYGANAKVLSTVNQLLDVVINGLV